VFEREAQELVSGHLQAEPAPHECGFGSVGTSRVDAGPYHDAVSDQLVNLTVVSGTRLGGIPVGEPTLGWAEAEHLDAAVLVWRDLLDALGYAGTRGERVIVVVEHVNDRLRHLPPLPIV
jgi:hypothetical protein